MTRYVFLTVLDEDAGRAAPGVIQWRVRCDCGTEKLVRKADVRSGKIRACGRCQFTTRMTIAAKGSHGESGAHASSEYVAWSAMRQRCNYVRHVQYKDYGGRGIRVCKEWNKSFETFLADMGRKPSPRHSVDRIDTDGNYGPGNCRWATTTEQLRNTRRTRWVMYRGRRMSLAEACEIAGMKYHTASDRIYRGWSAERAIDTPLRIGNLKIEERK